MRLIFDKSVPGWFRDEIRDLARAWRRVFFKITDEIHFTLADDELDGSRINVQSEYRRGFVEIGVPMLSYPAWRREEQILHEFAHLFVSDAMRLAYAWSKLAAPDDSALQKHLWKEVGVPIFEALTEDITRALIQARKEGQKDG